VTVAFTLAGTFNEGHGPPLQLMAKRAPPLVPSW